MRFAQVSRFSVKKYGKVAILTADELAEQLGISIRVVLREIRDGKLKAKLVGGRYYITDRAVANFFLTEATEEA